MQEIIQIDNKTWRIEDTYVRFFLIAGEEKAVLLDSGINCANARKIAESLTDLPIMLINTHGDGDHVSGTGDFDEVHMAPQDYYNKEMDKLFPETKLVELNDGDVIDLGGRRLEVIAIPGHTKGSIAILDVTNRYLFSGDSVQSGFIFMFGDHRNPEDFEDSLIKLEGEKNRFDLIFPSHDNPELKPEYIEKVLKSWREVRDGMVEYEIVNLHGSDVKAYATSNCGFYCDMC